MLASAGTEQVRQQTAKQRNAINLFIGLPENVCYLDFTPKLCRSHGPLMTEVIAICLPLACRQPHEERLNGLNILEPWHLQALPFWALVFNLREVAQDFETVGSGFTAAYVSIRFWREESRGREFHSCSVFLPAAPCSRIRHRPTAPSHSRHGICAGRERPVRE